MKLHSSWFLFLAAFPLSAGTIDVSRAATAQLEPGDSLVFDIPSSNYSASAVRFGLTLYPTGVSFALMSEASDLPATFEAWLQSSDGSFSKTLGAPLTFSPGALSSSAYSGAVSTLEGFFQLTAKDSQQIFSGLGAATGAATGAVLTLRNLGPAVLLGLPGTALRQDLFATLSGGPLEVGALHGAVLLRESLPQVPEPHSGALLIAGGLVLCLAARPLERISRRQTEWH